MEKVNVLFGKNSLQTVVLSDAIKLFMATTRNKYTLSNEKSVKALFADVVYSITNNPMCRRFWQTSIEVKNYFKKYGIESSFDFAEKMKNNLKNLDTDKFNLRIFKDVDINKVRNATDEIDFSKLTKMQRKGAEYVQANGIGLNAEEAGNFEDNTRLMAVRSKYGSSEVKFYKFSGSTNKNNPEINAIKAAYHYETGCKYFEARPILYSTWINLPVDRQNSTVNVDSSDM